MGLAPGAVIRNGTSPWRIVMYGIWVLTALFVVVNVVRIAGIATGKIQVKEKKAKIHVVNNDDEY